MAVRHEQDEYLGTGVDIFRFDPWKPSFKARMLEDPVREESPIDRSQYREISEDNLLEVSRQIGVEAGLKGGYAGVTASVKTKFKRSEERSQKTHFLKISFTNSGTVLYVEGSGAQIRAQLNEEFKSALNDGDPDKLIRDYGTHLVTRIIVGGRAEYYARSSATSSMTKEQFEVAARAKYDSLGGVAGEDADAATGSVQVSTRVGTTDTTNLKDVVSSESIDTIGGTAVSAVGIKSKRDWDTWATSIATRPGFLGFDVDGLMPIWELTTDPARQKAIYEAYRRKAAKEFAPEILNVTSDVRNHPDVRIVVPEGYKLLCGGALDNWKGSGNLLTASFPESDNTWRGSGKDHVAGDPASISAFALTVYDPDDIWEARIFQSRPSSAAAHPEQEVAVEPGYVMVGGGAWVDWTGEGNLLVASHPTESKTAWRVQSKDHVKSSPARITAYAVGLRSKVEGIKLQSSIATAKSSKSNRPQAAAAPPSGYKMVGGGAALTFDKGGLLLTASYPNENNQWVGQGKDHLEGDNGSITVYCIGLKVD
jgi:MAC/Perforin domain